jgi:hypothetical protein
MSWAQRRIVSTLDGGNRLLARLRQVGSVAEFNAPRLGSGQRIARPRGADEVIE